MNYESVRLYIERCAEADSTEIRWCDHARYVTENTIDASPGEYLNRYGYYVIGTTIGGNVIALSQNDPRVVFADHSWYFEDIINYKNLSGSGEWIELPLTAENLKKSLHCLADSREGFLKKLRTGWVSKHISEIN